MADVAKSSRPSGTITIRWEDFGDDQEPNFRINIHYEPGFGPDERLRIARLFRQIAEMSEADLDVAWPADETGNG